MPFFLRGRRVALLEPAIASPGLDNERVYSLPPLRVLDLEMNVGNLRMDWFWKRERRRYFHGIEWLPPR